MFINKKKFQNGSFSCHYIVLNLLLSTHFYRDPEKDWKELPKKLLSKLPLVLGMPLSMLLVAVAAPLPNPAMLRMRR